MSRGTADLSREATRQARRPGVEWVLRQGWTAKGVVYVLIGVVAFGFVFSPAPADDEASPEGALEVVADRAGGRLLLGVLGVGLVLYVLWRIVTVLVVRGSDATAWLERVGYACSAAFYSFLAFTALRHALAGSSPDDSFTVERLSSALLRHTWGRVALGALGLVILAVAAVFAYRAVTADFTKGITGLSAKWSANHGVASALYVLGMAGWIGRAVVVAMIGFFVGRAALRADADEASGFDHALRRAAADPLGRWLVVVAAIGLVLYGLYCVLSAPRRDVGTQSS